MRPELDQRIRAALCLCFPKDAAYFRLTRSWHGSWPTFSVLAQDANQQVLAHVGVHERFISAGGQQVFVGGIQNVCVLPSHRGCGLSSRLMALAAQVMRSRLLDAGLLFCVPELVRLYARMGWMPYEPTAILRIDEHGHTTNLPGDNVPMTLPLHLPNLSPGPLHLQGNDW